MVYFQGSDLENHMVKAIADRGFIVNNKDICETIKSILFIVANQFDLRNTPESKRSIVVLDHDIPIIRFKYSGGSIVGDFSIKRPNRLKVKPIYLDDILDEKNTKDFLRVYGRMQLCVYDFIYVIFKCIGEWIEQNPDDELSLFSIFNANKKGLRIHDDIMIMAGSIQRLRFLECMATY